MTDPDKTDKIEVVPRVGPRPKLGLIDRVLKNPFTTLGALASASVIGVGEVWQANKFEPWGGITVLVGATLATIVGIMARDK